MKELKLEELTVEQKIGMAIIGGHWKPMEDDPDEMAFHLELIRKHALGGVWVSCNAYNKNYKKTIQMLREAADYPILIYTDAENGYGDYRIGENITLGYVGSEEHAYAFGKATAIQARKDGFSIVCDPLLDRSEKNVPCGGVVRSLHPDKEKCTALAEAVVRGMHDGGLLSMAKHYPSTRCDVDTHMAEGCCELDYDTIWNENLYPYRELQRKGLLDGVMVGHNKLAKIDPEHPATLSKKVKDILRSTGFDGLMVTDSMSMMGVVAKYGWDGSRSLALSSGNDQVLVFSSLRESYASLMKAYQNGEISDERLDEAVRRVLEAQHKAVTMPADAVLTDREKQLLAELNLNCVAAVTDPGVPVSLDPNGRHFFVLLTEDQVDLNKPKENDSMSVEWYDPVRLSQHILKRFPNSGVYALNEFPARNYTAEACRLELEYDDVVFVTFFNNYPYIGKEMFTPRIISLFEAWQITDRISTVVHFGNPFLLEELPHIPRILNGCKSLDCTLNAIDILAGLHPAKGKIPYDLKLK